MATLCHTVLMNIVYLFACVFFISPVEYKLQEAVALFFVPSFMPST